MAVAEFRGKILCKCKLVLVWNVNKKEKQLTINPADLTTYLFIVVETHWGVTSWLLYEWLLNFCSSAWVPVQIRNWMGFLCHWTLLLWSHLLSRCHSHIQENCHGKSGENMSQATCVVLHQNCNGNRVVVGGAGEVWLDKEATHLLSATRGQRVYVCLTVNNHTYSKSEWISYREDSALKINISFIKLLD